MKRFYLIFLLPLLIGCQSLSNPNTSGVSFFTFGDFGTGTDTQKAVALALEKHCAQNPCNFGLLLGDNFYENGVNSVGDSKWQDYFEAIYLGLPLAFYAALGNHDYQGNVQAQIDYTHQQDRWKMPARKYQVAFPETEPIVEIFIVDSNQFGPDAAQGLQNQLETSIATWKIVAMHHPLYSNGNHGDTPFLKDDFLDVVCQRADVILSGHDHVFSHLEDPNDGCKFHQFVIGTGGRFLHEIQADPRAHFSLASYGFAYLRASRNELSLRFFDTDGELRYEFTQQH